MYMYGGKRCKVKCGFGLCLSCNVCGALRCDAMLECGVFTQKRWREWQTEVVVVYNGL